MKISVCDASNNPILESVLGLAFGKEMQTLSKQEKEKFFSSLHDELNNSQFLGTWYASIVDGKIVGCVAYFPPFTSRHPLFQGNCSHINLLGVLPSYQRQGIAHGLLLHCIQKSISDGAISLALQTSGIMHSAMRLYDSLGFTKTQLSNPPIGEPIYLYEKWFIKGPFAKINAG